MGAVVSLVVSKRGSGVEIEEIRRVYEARLPELRRLAEAVVGDREQALDAVQEAFARAVRLRGSFTGRGSVDGWVWRIVINTARDQAAARRREELSAAVDDRGAVERPEDAERVRVAVSLLPERQRLVLFLRYYGDLEYGAIAEALGISTGTVGATLNSAHTRLRSLLEEVSR